MARRFILFAITVLYLFACMISSSPAQESQSENVSYRISVFYRNPDIDQARALLKDALAQPLIQSPSPENSHASDLVAYFFGQLARKYPELIPDMQETFAEAGHAERLFLLRVFWFSGSSAPAGFLTMAAAQDKYSEESDAIEKTLESFPGNFQARNIHIRQAGDLDFLWMDFFATGEGEPLRRVIGVLDRKDLSREKLNAWLENQAGPEPEWIRLIPELGIDWEDNTIRARQDLDLFLVQAIEGSVEQPRAAESLIEALELDEEAMTHITLKGQAEWSLAANGVNHDRVLEELYSVPKAADNSYAIALYKIIAEVEEDRGNFAKAIDALDQWKALEPQRHQIDLKIVWLQMERGEYKEARKRLENVEAHYPDTATEYKRRIALEQALRLDLEKCEAVKKTGKSRELAMRASRKAGSAEAYASLLRIRTIEKGQPVEGATIRWQFLYVSPDRYDVNQQASVMGREAYDRWITIGRDSWSRLGEWMHDKDTDRLSTNRFLSANKWIQLLNASAFDKAVQCRDPESDAKYIVLSASEVNPPRDVEIMLSPEGPAKNATIWMDAETMELIKISLDLQVEDAQQGKAMVRLEQSYLPLSEDIKIEKPEVLQQAPDASTP
ncbi:MAG: tetratricopeptide repeat protein [Candidatus Sumerlaeota bacterium]